MNNIESITVVPDPSRTLEGLRDTGYFLETAIADLVDNSIAAKATIVDIRLESDFRGDIVMSMADNGTGMDREGLISAMKYGAPKGKDPASLGKFGLGLKTASTAFCRRLSVVSRMNPDSPALMATWDLDHVEEVGEWDLQFSGNPNRDAYEHLDTIASNHSGTVVLWEKVDRLLKKYQIPDGKHAVNALKKRCEKLYSHLAVVFQRYLDPNDDRSTNISIYLNGEAVTPWDPFQIDYSAVVAEERIDVQTTHRGKTDFLVKAYVLPHRDENPEIEKHGRLTSDAQGIYVYRENRLIQGATWLGMYSKEPHYTLLRVELSFDHKLDEALELDIKKSQIILDDVMLKYLKDQFLNAPRNEANRRYRIGGRKRISRLSSSAHDRSNNSIRVKESSVGGAEVQIVDKDKGVVSVKTPHGTYPKRLRICAPKKPGEVFVQPATDVEDGAFFEPALIDQKKAVRINTNHPYYSKVYIPNLSRSVTIQGMDSLLWALCVAELNATTDNVGDFFGELRRDLSRILRYLVEDMPEPNLEEERDED